MSKQMMKKRLEVAASALLRSSNPASMQSFPTLPPSTGVSSGSLKITEVPIPTDNLFDQRISDFTKTVERMRCIAAFERALDIFKEQVLLNVRHELDRAEKKEREIPPSSLYD
jgi:hypothetical protein